MDEVYKVSASEICAQESALHHRPWHDLITLSGAPLACYLVIHAKSVAKMHCYNAVSQLSDCSKASESQCAAAACLKCVTHGIARG